MYQTVNEDDFIDAFRRYDRLRTETTGGNFTTPALRALFAWLEEYEVGTGESIELDVVALCCDFAQYDDDEGGALACVRENGFEPDPEDGDPTDTALAWLSDRTTVIPFDGGVLVQAF